MKKLALLSAIAISGFMINTADAQIGVRAGIGYAPQRAIYATYPAAVQAPVNNDGDDYYYLPDLGVYYNVTDQCYFYFDGTEWISSAYLPGQYSNYDWRNARRFEVRAAQPYLRDDFYRSKYDGNRFEGWAHANSNYNAAYANQAYKGAGRDFNNDNNRYNQPVQVQYHRSNDQHVNGNQGAYTQPVQQNRNNNQGFNNRGQGFNSHQNDQGGGNDKRGGNAQYGQNNRQNGNTNHRMTKF